MAQYNCLNMFYERTNGVIKDNFFIELSQYNLYENGSLIKQGPFFRNDDDCDITLLWRDDDLTIQCFGLEPFNIRNHLNFSVDKVGSFAQDKGVSYVVTLIVRNKKYSVNPGQIPYKITITTYKDSIYSLSLFFQVNGVDQELELFGKSDWFRMPGSNTPPNNPLEFSDEDIDDEFGDSFDSEPNDPSINQSDIPF